MGKKFVTYLLIMVMLFVNINHTILAAEGESEVSDTEGSTIVEIEDKESKEDVEESTQNIFGDETEVETSEDQENKDIEERFETETVKIEDIEEINTENGFSDIETEKMSTQEVSENEDIQQESQIENTETEEMSIEDLESKEVEKEIEEDTLTEYDYALESEKQIIVQTEMKGVYQFGDMPSEQKQENASTYSIRNNEAVAYIYQEIMKSYEAGENGTTITVSDYEISEDNVIHLISGLKNDYPELYFVNKKFTYAMSGNRIVSIILTYDMSLPADRFKQGTEEALSVVKPTMNDLEKAIVLHDYLTVNCEYDKERLENKTIPDTSYSAYGVLVNHIAVCQGYALTYKYLLNQVGIECYMVSSDSMNHAWNLIVLDGEYYQVDVTWDDPTWDLTGRARHTYMFLSDSAFEKVGSGHSNWNVTIGTDIVDYKATSTYYDSAFWADCKSPLVILENDCYYVSFSEQVIKKINMENIEGTGTTVCEIGGWPTWENGSSIWGGTYSGLFDVNDRLYFNDKSSIYSIDLDGGNQKTEFTADISSGYIYGSALRQGKVYYCLRTTPNITAKETVLIADINFEVDEEENITWTLNNGQLTISGNGKMDDYSTQSEAPWFSEQDSITKVVIENGITSIGDYAFYKCTNLTQVDIPDSVKNIGNYAFYKCINIENIKIPKNVTEIGDAAFCGCSSLTEIDIPEGITHISYSLFNDCKNLKKVTLPESILSIDSYAFYECSSLTEIIIPENVTDISGYVFARCSSLVRVNIPQKLTYISVYLFYDCSSLTNITIPDNITRIAPMAFAKCSSLSKITIPASVTEIGGETKGGKTGIFKGCNSLTSAGPIGGGYCYEYGWTEKLPDLAFWGCESLEKVVIPDSVVDLGNRTFLGCHSLNDINIPKGVTSIGNYIFDECDGLTNFNIPEGIISIGAGTFRNCSNLKSVTLPESIINIYGDTFRGCSSLESITIPQNITSIERDTFRGCSNLTEVRLLGNIIDIKDYAFYECSSLNKISLPESITNIEKYAFYGCESLVNIVIPKSVTNIGYCAFQNCSKLYEIEIPEGIIGIYYETFLNCSSLTSVIIPDSVTKIGADAFKNCISLSKIVISDNVINVGEEGYKFEWFGAFSGCSSLLSAGPVGGGYNLEFGWTSSIPQRAFFDCSSLTSLVIPEGITTINSGAFHGCTGLSSITIPEGVSQILDIFDGCSNLKTIVIPSSVTEISEKAFADCSNLTDIYYNGSQDQWEAIDFGNESIYLESVNIHYNTAACTITFNANNGFVDTSNKIVLRDEACGTLPIPERDGYNFLGWYTESDGTGEELTEETIIAQNTTVYAKWEKIIDAAITYTIIYDMQGHGSSIDSIIVNEGDKLIMPSTPIESGYLFEGWYKEKSCITAWDFDKDIVTEDTILYAKWVENIIPIVTYTITFDMQGHGEQVASITVNEGCVLIEPVIPMAEGYTFLGWYKEAKCTNAWKFEKDIVDADLTLYAGWRYSGNIIQGDTPDNGIPEGLWIAGIQDYTYSGKAIRPEVRVYFENKKLKEGQDYTISYKNNLKAAGHKSKKAPTVTIKGKGNYSGTATKTFTINRVMLTSSNLKASSVYQMGKTYTPVIMLNGIILKKGTDYTITYKDNNNTILRKQPIKELGNYIMHIEGKGNCMGSFDFKYKIAQSGNMGIQKGKATVGNMIYGGKYPATTLSVNGRILTNKDYTVIFSNTNTKGTATATFIGIGNYTGVLKKNFKVTARSLQNANITVAKSVAYEKGGAKPEVSVKLDGINLFAGVDYTVNYKGNTKLGNIAKVSIKGKGNYNGSISANFLIKGKAFNENDMKILISDTVIGKKPTITIYDTNGKKLSSGSDYQAIIDKIAHTVTITGGKNKCYTGTIVKTYKELTTDKIITSVKLNKNAIDSLKDYNAYTGKGITLKNKWLTVKAKNIVLPSDCYTLDYVNNVKKGTATVIVQGINGYSGIKMMSFNIKTYSLKSILTWFTPRPDASDSKNFIVKFLANGGRWGDTDEITVAVESGAASVLPEKPIRKGYVFTEWKDGEGNVFFEGIPITEDITVYAQWEVDKLTDTYADPFALPELTGDRRTDFIAVAMSQIGYMEARDGSTYFGAWAGDPYCAWCSEFTSWCAEQAKIPKSVIPKATSSKKYRDFFASKGRYFYIKEGIDGKNTDFMKNYKNISTVSIEDLEAGDIILTETNGNINDGPDHTAIFLQYEDGIVKYISGNTGDSVMMSTCSPVRIHGICRPNF